MRGRWKCLGEGLSHNDVLEQIRADSCRFGVVALQLWKPYHESQNLNGNVNDHGRPVLVVRHWKEGNRVENRDEQSWADA